MILVDNETKVDLLNSDSVAETIVKLIRDRPEHPITVGVHGDWGAGKSSVLEMIEVKLKDESEVLCIKFNGWRFQGFEDAKIALIEGIVTELIDKKSLYHKAADEVKDIFERINWLKVAKRTGGLAFTALTGIPTGDVIQTVINNLQEIAGNPDQLATKENLETLTKETNALLKPKEASKNIPTEIAAFRKAFDKLLEKAGVKQLIVLVDDLDRCLPDTAIETLEAIRLFILTNKTAFVIAADEGMIEYAVKKHFPDLPDTPTHQAYTRNYLEKLIQVPFKIPVLGEIETKIYTTLLLVGSEIGECEEFDALIKIAKEKLKKPWENTSLDSETIRLTLASKASKVQNALIISDQVGPILASGLHGNPRQIKRFLNTLLLRYRMAEARGFGEVVKLPILAKLMIAERFLPRLFEQIATISAVSSEGRCGAIQLLEDQLSEENRPKSVVDGADSKQPKQPDKKKEKPIESLEERDGESSLLLEWNASDSIKEWAKVQPMLAEVDLRPYIFIAKEKKDFFGTSTSLGHLTVLIEKLFGNKLSVKMLTPEVKLLSKADATRVFEEVRSRILGKSDFTTAPEGIDGLTLLVQLHSELQDNLIDLLEGLPTSKLGPWVVKGWDGVIQGEAKQRFNGLIDRWIAGSTKNLMLKTAAEGVKRMR